MNRMTPILSFDPIGKHKIIMVLMCSFLWLLTACIHRDNAFTGGNKGFRAYRVVAGDSLSKIADQFGVSVSRLMELNRLKDGNSLLIGQILQVPSKRRGSKSNGHLDSRHRGYGRIFGDNRSLLWPAQGPVSSGFGMRGGRPHHGIDIAAGPNEPVIASASGRVSFVGWMRGYGRTIIIDHDGMQTLYAHLAKNLVKKRQMIDRGRVIGLVGNSGNARGYHLHFEIRKRGKPKNPMAFFNRRLLSWHPNADANPFVRFAEASLTSGKSQKIVSFQ
ncbi:MAG: LysM peptidoglycan-binding domain-containing M23 family metallopeptidase [Pseudobacteriovorax sp.]|nr:LysM peptidoglycan-binding domain-containing M23 family metallopeptidase [Pseudobacteriovorax sp.]